MAEIILDFIQCHHCEKRFEPDDPLANEHWKDCQFSPAKDEYTAMEALLRKIREMIALDPAIWTAETINEIDALLGDEANG